MRRDYLTYGLVVLVIGAVLWALPDDMGVADTTANARADGTTAAGWLNWLGGLAVLIGLGLALAGVFMDNRGRLTTHTRN